MIKVLRIYTIVFCVLLFLSETAVLLNTEKFWPLSADDYVAIALLLWSLRLLDRLHGQLLQLATWGYLSGKFYNLLFVRLDLAEDASAAVLALAFLFAEAVLGLILVGVCLRARTP